MTPLTQRQLFTEISYGPDSPATDSYPASISLPVVTAGRLNVIVWQQDLFFDDILIRTTESMETVAAPTLVQPGDVAALATGPEWQNQQPRDGRRNEDMSVQISRPEP